jgi:probable rRNA maturation factor
MTITAPKLHITIDDPRWQSHRLGLEKLCTHAITHAWSLIGKKKSPPIFVSITFTNDKIIKKINAHTRGKNKPTNILSFQNFESVSDLPPLKTPVPVGDLILAYETIFAEAESDNKKVKHHLTRIHSLKFV